MKIERKTAGDVTVLALAGAIDADAVRALREKTDAIVETGCHQLVFSLREVEFFDSRVIACLITASLRLQGVNGDVVISGSPSAHETLETLGLARQLKVFPDERAALAYFGEEGGDFGGCGARLTPPHPSGSGGAWPEEHPRPRP